MSLGTGFQIIGTIFTTIGSILAITELWRRTLCKSIFQTKKEIQKCIKYNFDLAEKFKEEEVNPDSEKFSWENYEKLADYLENTFFKSEENKSKAFSKLGRLLFLRRFLIPIAIYLIISGMILQIIGLCS